ncbi:hypothetical protein LAZ67_11003179 [Cordylochernes scorpioides]|uniref:Uncharacterized protein n=1 Tax=Cordylochernes scorpioides TaxID=51811 RepID=A0ABY6KZN4_9ARAC|nr:hypothetical protein LAZ67_11003179 [Cordylochernes scorpioides]
MLLFWVHVNFLRPLLDMRILHVVQTMIIMYKRFKEGQEETADNERSGRPSTSTTPEKVDKVLELAMIIMQFEICTYKCNDNHALNVTPTISCKMAPPANLRRAVLFFLLDKAVSPDKDGDRGLHLAVLDANPRLVQLYLRLMAKMEISVDVANRYCQTGLHLAAISRNPGLVRQMLTAGADLGRQDVWGYTALHLSVLEDSPHCLAAALERGTTASTYEITWVGARVRDLGDPHIARPTRSALADAAALAAFCQRVVAENVQDESFRGTTLAGAVVLRGTATPFLGLTTRSARRALDRPRLAATPISGYLARWAATISQPARMALHALPHPAHPASAGSSCPACGSVDCSLCHRYWSCQSIRPLVREAFNIIGRPPDLQAWIFGSGLEDEALTILASAKLRIYRHFVQRMPGHRKRRQFKQTDAFTRGMVIGLKRAGWSIRQIAADTHLGASTVHRLWRRWLEQGNVAIYRNAGATRVTSARVDRRILRQAVAAPQATCTAILQHVCKTP